MFPISPKLGQAVAVARPKKKRLALEFIILLSAGMYGAHAMAQAVPTPGTVLETVRPDVPVTPALKNENPMAVPAAPDMQNQDPNAPRALVTDFRITGSNAIDAATLQGLIADRADKPYNLYELQKTTRVISDYYPCSRLSAHGFTRQSWQIAGYA